jgi:hypothetical protein
LLAPPSKQVLHKVQQKETPLVWHSGNKRKDLMKNKALLTTVLVILALVAGVTPALASNGQGQTPLSVAVTASQVCDNGLADITLTFQVSSGNTSGGTLNWSFAGQGGAITINAGLTTDDPAGDWTQASSGPVKTFTTTVTVYGVAAGTYDATATVGQQGGDYTDQTDSDNVVVTNCAAAETCDQLAQPVGQVTGNKNLAKSGTPVNIVFKGAFGDAATLTINLSNSTVVLAPTQVARNGNSCVYNYQWIPVYNGTYLAAGNYTATVTGNDQTPLTFSFDLTYKGR